MVYSNMQLLVQSPETQLPTHLKFSKALQLLEFSTHQTIEALDAFYFKKKIYEFDPHVGETSCQIRAYQVMLLTTQIELVKFRIARKLKSLREMHQKIKSDLTYFQKLDNTRRVKDARLLTLASFIEENKYCFELTEDELFLVYARVLTIYKNFAPNGDPQIDFNKLSQNLDASKDTTRRLVRFYQRRLSEMSCQFIFKLLKEIPKSLISFKVLETLICQDDDGRFVIPCFLSASVILSHMYYTNATILLAVKRIHKGHFFDMVYLPFSIAKNASGFRLNVNNYTNIDKPCYVMRCITKYETSIELQSFFISRILKLGLEKLFLLNEAAHSQFSGRKLEHLSANPFRLISDKISKIEYQEIEKMLFSMQLQADRFGCSINNQSLLYIEHIFCDSLSRQMNLNMLHYTQELLHFELRSLLTNVWHPVHFIAARSENFLNYNVNNVE